VLLFFAYRHLEVYLENPALVLFVILIPVIGKLHGGSASCRAMDFPIRIASL